MILRWYLILLPAMLSPATLPADLSVAPIRKYQIILTGIASWYHLPGKITASGVKYGGMTAAHRHLAFGEQRTLTANGRAVVVTVVDRFGKDDPADREWDLSRQAARKLGMLRVGVINVKVR